MKYALIIISLVALVAPVPAQVRTPADPTDKDVLAERAWLAFFPAFRGAVNKRDRVALKEMMAPDFFYTLGHHASDQRDAAFVYWDEQRGHGWKAFSRILRMGALRTTDKGFSNTGEINGPMRIAPPAAAKLRAMRRNLVDWYAVFEFRGDGRWYCITFVECCD